MHAVLLVSAKHLSYLAPNNSEYHQASLFHLSRLLPRYRAEVSEPLSAVNADIVMAASFLLLYFFWSNVDTFDIKDPACFINDQLFAMTPGVRETFISGNFILSSGQSIFSECTAYHPKYGIEKLAKQCSRTPSQFEQYFCDTYQESGNNGIMEIQQDSAQKIPRFSDIQNGDKQMSHNNLWYAVIKPHDPTLIGFLDVAVRLAPLSSISSELETLEQESHSSISGTQEKESQLSELLGTLLPVTDLARYIFSWPVVCCPGVLRLLEQKDQRIIFLLYQFYKTIKVILPKVYWWAHQRSDKMMSALQKFLPEEKLNPSIRQKGFTVPNSAVERATNFTIQANQAWRDYCLIYATTPER